jgi:integrase
MLETKGLAHHERSFYMGQSFQKGNILERRRRDGSIAFQLRYRVRAPDGIGEWEWQTETLPRSVVTKKQAERELATRLRPINDAGGGVVGPGSRSIRFSELVESYWPLYVANQNMRPGTLDAYAAMLGKWIRPFFQDLMLGEITSAHVSKFLGKLDQSGLASKYRRNIYNLVNEVFEVAVANGLILSNPVRSKIHRPAVFQDQEKGVLSSDQCWALIAAVRERRDKALLWTFMLTGMRQGEVLGLRRMDVDLESRKITATYVLYRGRLLRGLKKHKRARKPRQHQVLIPEMLDMILRDHMESSPFQGPEDFVFHKSDGSPVDPDVFRSDVLYPALRQLGIPILRRASGFHMFRHTAASLINKETGNMKLSQAQLGHANVQITADVYTHLDETQKRKAAEALERGVFGKL